MNDTFLAETLQSLTERGLKRELKTVTGSQGREITVNGRTVLNFCSNNYLGLADDERLKEAAISSIREEGFGSGASRLVCGNMSSHARLEKKMAEFKGAQKALVFSSGYMANVGIISSLYGRDDVIFSDKLNHASILDGILLSGSPYKRYAHADMESLEAQLKDSPAQSRKLIVTDSVFSMDGDLALLPDIVRLADRYGAMVMVDEAHALGVMGKNGKGLVEHFGLEGKIDIQMGTFSKAAGSFGAYVCGSEKLIDFLINKTRSFIYTTGLPPSVCAASLAGIEIIEQEPERRQKLWDNTNLVSEKLRVLGFDTLNSRTPVIPVLVGDPAKAVRFSEKLFAEGIFVSAIRPPTVPVHTSRLRITVTAVHTKADLEFLLRKLETIGKELCLI